MTQRSDTYPPPTNSTSSDSQLEPQRRFEPPADIQDVFAPRSETENLLKHAVQTSNLPSFQYNASLHPLDTAPGPPTFVTHGASPLSAELRLQTDMWPMNHREHARPSPLVAQTNVSEFEPVLHHQSSLPVRSSSVKSLSASHYTSGSLSPASGRQSPNLAQLSDITPLPSPIGASPSPWSRMPQRETGSPPIGGSSSPTSSAFPQVSPPRKRKAFVDLLPPMVEQPGLSAIAVHNRNRSLSEYVPVGAAPRSRNVAVSGSQTPTSSEPPSMPMQREEYLAVQRGILALPTPRPPTPPPSNRSVTDSSDTGSPPSYFEHKHPSIPSYEATSLRTGKTKRWVSVRQLGMGTFSRVMLATSDLARIGKPEQELDPKTLVAVKVCDHGPAGGADEKKIESSLKRELEILKAINHPSLVHLKAVNISEKRSYLVLSYCPGGDMFELASLKLNLLVPSLVRRIFSELIAAVRYLHEMYIVHRDIKLENVLMNVPLHQISTISDWETYPTPVVTLTDLGLGRFIPKPPDSPMLNTRCGSEDYAAPELLMGQEYDGRQTDGWALGVLLYALMEGRLPFDPVPNARRQSPTSHRIARCEWSWVKYADKDGDWDEEKGEAFKGARECVEGLLKRTRNRWSLEKIAETDFVKGGVQVEGGLKLPGEI